MSYLVPQAYCRSFCLKTGVKRVSGTLGELEAVETSAWIEDGPLAEARVHHTGDA